MTSATAVGYFSLAPIPSPCVVIRWPLFERMARLMTRATFDDYAVALNPPEFTEPLRKRSDPWVID
jgi:hypothetical protein